MENNLGLLLELLGSEVTKLNSKGHKILDRVDIGDHTMLLVQGQYEWEVQIVLTTGDNKFLEPEDQSKIPLSRPLPNPKELYHGLISKIKEWLNEHSPIMIGSLNKNRVEKYWRLCNASGIRCSKIEETDSYSYFKIL